MNHLYEEDGVVHSCDQCYVGVEGKSPLLVWTVCGFDVPHNKSFKSSEDVTCTECLSLLEGDTNE